MSLVLYRKWRPQTWDEVVGQEHIIQTLKNAISGGKVSHAYLFAGPRGTGKTSTARLLAKAVNCLEDSLEKRPCKTCDICMEIEQGRFLDLIEIDGASNTSVDDVRELRDKINFSPNRGRYKVYIIDEVHMLSRAAFNALLKTLEEPPPHAIFVLATTEAHKIPATVLSRCQRHEFRRLPVNEIETQMKKIVDGEGFTIDDQSVTLISQQATGSMRDAISVLDQLASTGQEITLERTRDVMGITSSQAVIDIVDSLVKNDPSRGMNTIQQAVDAGGDSRQFARQIVNYLRDVLLIHMDNKDKISITPEILTQMEEHADGLELGRLLQIIRNFNVASNDRRASWQPSLPLELALIESISERTKPVFPSNPSKTKTNPKKPSKTINDRKSKTEYMTPEDAEDIVTRGNYTADGSLFSKIQEQWSQIKSEVNKIRPNTKALLNACKPYGLKDGVLFLGFSGEFSKNKMEEAKNIKIAQQVIANIMGTDIPLRCFLAAGSKGGLPVDIESDGMIASALRDLGGEVVDI